MLSASYLEPNMAGAGVEVKIFVLSNIQMRQSERGEYYVAMVYENSSRSVKLLYLPKKNGERDYTKRIFLMQRRFSRGWNPSLRKFEGKRVMNLL